jgi:disulfide bond formation protein DsbB/cytochrome c5
MMATQKNTVTEDDEQDEDPHNKYDGFYTALGRNSRYVALLVAWIATCGSLFFSEVLGWVPCLLCWYQRILMYPLALVLAVGLLRRDKGIHKYALVLSIPGACVSLFHYLDQKTDLVRALVPCTVGVPCSADYLNAFGGVVTIPFLALIAFLIITFCMVASRLGSEPDADADVASTTSEKQPGRIATALPVFVIIAAVVIAYLISGASYRNAAAGSPPGTAAVSNKPLPTPDSTAAVRGKVLYESACAACHGIRGEGTSAGMALTTSKQVLTASDETLVKFVRLGRAANDPHNITGMAMPANGGRSDASDQDIVAVITYMRQLAKYANPGA